MNMEIKAPKIPDDVKETLKLVKWHKKPGDHCSQNETLLDVETDKTVLEVYAPAEGTLQKLLKNEGDTLDSEEVVAIFLPDEDEQTSKKNNTEDPTTEPDKEGLIHIKIQDHISTIDFSEILAEFSSAYASIRFLLRELHKDSNPNQLLSFPTAPPLPSLAQPILSKAQFKSPGFLEAIGNLNPLKVLCDYLQQRHERKKDNKYRSEQERQKLILENMRLRNKVIIEKIEIMEKSGLSKEQINEILGNYIADSLKNLGARIDSGQVIHVELIP